MIMSDLFWVTQTQLNKIKPYFPLSRGVPRVDDLRAVSGIIFVIKRPVCNGATLQAEYGPYKTLYNRFVRWSRIDVFNQIFSDIDK